MTAHLGNPNGAINPLDFGAPKVITAYAREVISGGAMVFASGAEAVVGSGADSFVSADVKVAADASGADFLGIALKDAASGAAVPVALDGAFILKCTGSVLASQPIWTAGSSCVETMGSLVIPASSIDAGMAARKIGRAYTAGASGGFALVGIIA